MKLALHPSSSLSGTPLCRYLYFPAPHLWHFHGQIRLILSLSTRRNVTSSGWQSPSCSVLSVCHIVSQCVSGMKCLSNVLESTADEILDKWAITPECVCVCVSVSNIAGRLKPTNTGSLLPALSYLYCCLSLSPAHCTDRGQTHFLLVSLTRSFYLHTCVLHLSMN